MTDSVEVDPYLPTSLSLFEVPQEEQDLYRSYYSNLNPIVPVCIRLHEEIPFPRKL